MENLMDIDYLRSLDVKPTWFGLGFIQLRLSPTRRMHFWHPGFRAIDAYDKEWHDHRYDFTSNVLVGELTNYIATSIPHNEGEYEVHQVCCEGNGAEFSHMARLIRLGKFTTVAGKSYSIDRDTLHQITTTDFCATVQTRSSGSVKQRANIVCEKYLTANPFDARASETVLWEAISDVLGRPGYHLATIERGELGEVSKIREELDELVDAVAQDCRIMQLVEASDLIGALEAFITRHHPGFSLDDLTTMHRITSRAFRNGRR